MPPIYDIDRVLESREWQTWRKQYQDDPEALAQGAREWCASAYWKFHTPRLEDWKIVSTDLRARRLTESMLAEMAGSDDLHLPFPPIPLFESEQVKDLCRILRDADAAAALAERLSHNDQMLTIAPGDAAAYCWENLPPAAKIGLDYAAWLWMLQDTQPQALPEREAIAELRKARTPRRDAAIRRLEALVRSSEASSFSTFKIDVLAAALAVAPQFPSAAAPEMGYRPQPPSQFPSGSAAAVGFEPYVVAPDIAQPQPAETPPRTQDLVRNLFFGFYENSDWRPVDADCVFDGGKRRSPLFKMTQYLRENDFAVALDDQAWRNLQDVFRDFPQLLGVDGANRKSPLPALEFACAVRSTVTPGQVALDLLPYARKFWAKAEWWQAVGAALRPAPRRAGWWNANDRWLTAIDLVSQGAEITQAERASMEAGFRAALEESANDR